MVPRLRCVINHFHVCTLNYISPVAIIPHDYKGVDAETRPRATFAFRPFSFPGVYENAFPSGVHKNPAKGGFHECASDFACLASHLPVVSPKRLINRVSTKQPVSRIRSLRGGQLSNRGVENRRLEEDGRNQLNPT